MEIPKFSQILPPFLNLEFFEGFLQAFSSQIRPEFLSGIHLRILPKFSPRNLLGFYPRIPSVIRAESTTDVLLGIALWIPSEILSGLFQEFHQGKPIRNLSGFALKILVVITSGIAPEIPYRAILWISRVFFYFLCNFQEFRQKFNQQLLQELVWEFIQDFLQ